MNCKLHQHSHEHGPGAAFHSMAGKRNVGAQHCHAVTQTVLDLGTLKCHTGACDVAHGHI